MSSIDHWKGREFEQYTFGRNGRSAIEDLDARIQNRTVSGYDPDGLDMSSLYQGEFKTAADQLCSGQPVAPYFGRSTTHPRTPSSPRRRCTQSMHSIVWCLIPNRFLCTSSKACVWTASRSRRKTNTTWTGTASIPRLSGEWTVVDEGLNDASEYAEVTTNRNGYPVLKRSSRMTEHSCSCAISRRIRSKQRMISTASGLN